MLWIKDLKSRTAISVITLTISEFLFDYFLQHFSHQKQLNTVGNSTLESTYPVCVCVCVCVCVWGSTHPAESHKIELVERETKKKETEEEEEED